jgi:hypothetical protein
VFFHVPRVAPVTPTCTAIGGDGIPAQCGGCHGHCLPSTTQKKSKLMGKKAMDASPISDGVFLRLEKEKEAAFT